MVAALREHDVVEEFEQERRVELSLSRGHHEEIVAAVFRHPIVGRVHCHRGL